MRGNWRAAAAAAVLLVVLGAGYTIGRSTVSTGVAGGPSAGPVPFGHRHAVDVMGGLAVSTKGFTMVAPATTFVPGVAREFRFQIRDFGGQPVRTYDIVHDKPLHMVVVRSDLTGYQHLHPSLAADGTWTVPLTLPTPGVWRAYADFTARDAAQRLVTVVLGINLSAPGVYAPAAAPAPTAPAPVDGATVTWRGTPRINVMTPVDVAISGRDGAGIALQPHLGAYGHLVMIRESDLGFLHFHTSTRPAGGTLAFQAFVPGSGRYRAFIEFRFGGAVRTAEFAVDVP